MSVRALIDRISDTLDVPRRRSENCTDAIRSANEARNFARHAARLIQDTDPKAARQLHKAADQIGQTAKRMWSL